MKKENISICIVTFKQRFEIFKSLVRSLKEHNPDTDIIVAVNCNLNEQIDLNYRNEMLKFCLEITKCYPIFCPEFKSLSKLWNTLVIFSNNNYNFILNDDVRYDHPNLIENIEEYINESNNELFTLNNSWSHFIITKQILHKLNYFDERFIGVGEEDGDMVHRYIKKYNKSIDTFYISDFGNTARYDLRDEKIECNIDNKPKFNREFLKLKYKEDSDGICGMNPTPLKQVIDDLNQYPYEEFFIKNKEELTNYKEIKL